MGFPVIPGLQHAGKYIQKTAASLCFDAAVLIYSARTIVPQPITHALSSYKTAVCPGAAALTGCANRICMVPSGRIVTEAGFGA